MKVSMLLADFAEVVNNKLYLMGGGWSITGPQPAPTAVAVKIEVPWTEANQKHRLRLELLDTDFKPVLAPVISGGTAPVALGAEFEVGRAPGTIPGSSLDVPFAVNIPPIPLEPGKRYVWKLSINGESRDEWQTAFSTRPIPQPAPAPQAL